jgi:hypothetical protein
VITGGLRARYLHDSLTHLVRTGLEEQGWFDPGRSHSPIRVLSQPTPWNQPVEHNTLMVSASGRDGRYVEVGSTLTTDTIAVSVDFFAAGDSIGLHVISDVRDILRGRIGTGSNLGAFPLYDFNQATPPVIGHAMVANVTTARLPTRLGQEFTRHWYSAEVSLEDTYYDSEDLP